MAAIVRRHPFVLFGILTLILWLVWAGVGADYDSGGGATALFVVVYVLGVPFLAAAGIVGALIGDSAVAPVLWIPLGFGPYILADWLLRRRRQARTEARAV